MKNHVPKEVLLKAVKLIKKWHDFSSSQFEDSYSPFKFYYDNAPEMDEIKQELGSYSEMIGEVISATSISNKQKDEQGR